MKPFRALGGGERTVVGGPEGGVAVGLVHAEGERPLEAVALEERHQIVERGREPVDVSAHVDVGVEEEGRPPE